MEKNEKKYVIDDDYCFDIVCDGARPHSYSFVTIHVQWDHDEVMEMGEYFKEEEPYAMDYHTNGLDDEVNEALADLIADNLYEEWKEEYDAYWSKHDEYDADDDYDNAFEEKKEKDDFLDAACESMCDLYACWDQDLIAECIEYYEEHEEQEES